MVKMCRPWTGKKEETNPLRKEQHLNRKKKKATLRQLQDSEWHDQVKEFNAKESV